MKTHDHYEILKLILEETIDIKFKNFIIEDMYGNTLTEIKDGPFSHKLHGNLHSFNKHGFRSPDFKVDTDYLFSGCSITSGIGLPIEKIWPEILAKSLGSSYANIATSGDSISSQVYKIFKYINEFGNPKNIIALFGPTALHITGPYSLSGVRVIQKDTGCVIPCYNLECKDSRCMKAITVEEVLSAIQNIKSQHERN